MENTITTPAPKPADLHKIREMYLNGEAEDKSIAYKWLVQLVGMKDANANLFILTFYKDWDDDRGVRIDDKHWWDMRFATFPICFGKSYRYRVTIVAHFGGEELINDSMEYSRWEVGNGQPKYDMCNMLCQAFRKCGYTFYEELFKGK